LGTVELENDDRTVGYGKLTVLTSTVLIPQ